MLHSPVGKKKTKNSDVTLKDTDDKSKVAQNLSTEKKEDNIDNNVKNRKWEFRNRDFFWQ